MEDSVPQERFEFKRRLQVTAGRFGGELPQSREYFLRLPPLQSGQQFLHVERRKRASRRQLIRL
ncbi:hypothetical protein M3G15_14530 [Paenibacillus sp. p3-SID1389]|uniref:hypothetical protein n=1 Tax=Paenibacillus sp. p3-SID1389 TaxID=2916364 RepID=UPI0021A3CDA2|nr:hypothetical protein [Paenibacillus sp. p3-SID1389]MCT2196353.1 hypothetical protein [Paenibacillus sp. p3-SID1389]